MEKEKKFSENKEESKRIPLPPPDFSTLILSLSTTAMANLGLIPSLEKKETSVNLFLAKHTIDLINVLKEKTKGNLTPEEETLLNNLLYDLRLKYVEVSKKNEKLSAKE